MSDKFKRAPSVITQLMKKKAYLSATKMIITMLRAINGPDFIEINAVDEIRRWLEQKKIVINGIFTEGSL